MLKISAWFNPASGFAHYPRPTLLSKAEGLVAYVDVKKTLDEITVREYN